MSDRGLPSADGGPPRVDWLHKFRVAIRGAAFAIRSQVNFRVHLLVSLAVIVSAYLQGASTIEWGALLVCIAVVLSAETFNTSIEHLAKAITRQPNEEIRHALDVAAGAVLIAAIGAAIAGTVIFARLHM